MKILVSLKQVPRLDQVRFDRANRIVRENVSNVCNPLDTRALGHALSLRTESDEIVAITMGPPAAGEVLQDAIRRGADRGIHLTDRRFKGADTLATARALAEVVDRESPDLVLFGRSTLDGATAQLGQQVAELAGLSQVTEAVGMTRDDGALRVDRETEHGGEFWRSPFPTAVTVARGPDPGPPDTHRAVRLTELSTEDLEGAPASYGTRGSPTFVREVRVHEDERRHAAFVDVSESVDHLWSLTSDVEGGDRQPGPRPREAQRDVWVLVARDGEALDPITFEGLACARGVAAELDARVTAVLLAAEDDVSAALAAGGADRVLHVRHPRLGDDATAVHVDALASALDWEEPYVLVAPWTSAGRDYVPRVAARRGIGLTGDVTGVEIEPGDKPRVGWIKPAWAGTADALVISRTTPTTATLRPGAYRPLRLDPEAVAEVETVDVDLTSAGDDGTRLLSRSREVGECLVDRARVVFCLGDEVTPDAAAEVTDLAARWGAGVGGTVAAVARGLVPRQWELGVTKRSIAPTVCVALGVREAQDLAPMRGATHVVTVHPDSRVPAHDRADVQVVADPGELVRGLVERSCGSTVR